EIAERHAHGVRLTAADEDDIDDVADRVGAHLGGEILTRADRDAVEVDDDVADLEPGVRGAAAVDDRLNARADDVRVALARVGRDVRDGDAEKAVRRNAVLDELCGDSLHGVRGDREADADVAARAAGDRDVDADELATRVEQGAAQIGRASCREGGGDAGGAGGG